MIPKSTQTELATQAHIRIQTNGQCSMNVAAIDELGLRTGEEYYDLNYDQDTRMLSVHINHNGSYKLGRKHRLNSCFNIAPVLRIWHLEPAYNHYSSPRLAKIDGHIHGRVFEFQLDENIIKDI